MANLTIVVDDEVLRRARRRALDQGTSVNAVLREHLEAYAAPRNRRRAMQRFIARAGKSQARSAGSYSRDELHER